MSASHLLPAVVRLPRTVAARRALLVVAFLGGLLGLALLFGGSAQAAESHGPSSKDTEQAAEALDTGAATAQHGGGGQAQDGVVESLPQGDAIGQTVSQAVQPVAEPVGQITRPVGELVEATTGVSLVIPGIDTGAGQDTEEPGPSGGPASHHRHTPSTATTTAVGPVAPSQGPASDEAAPAAGSDARSWADGGDRNREPLPAPFPQTPCGTSSASAGDGGGPRGGDLHATAASEATRFGLVAGAVRAASTSPTRGRSLDILEFPG